MAINSDNRAGAEHSFSDCTEIVCSFYWRDNGARCRIKAPMVFEVKINLLRLTMEL